MLIGICAGLAILGLLAVDPVGIALMPLFLAQRHPYRRSGIFLLGSFLALMMWGVIFANGGGQAVIALERHVPWFMPGTEIIGGTVLGLFGVNLWLRHAKTKTKRGNSGLLNLLQLSAWKVFIGGTLLVTTQSALDIVFILAMIRVGQTHLPFLSFMVADGAYALAALLLQMVVVVIFAVTPPKQKQAVLASIRHFMAATGDHITIGISLLLGSALVVNGILALTGHLHI